MEKTLLVHTGKLYKDCFPLIFATCSKQNEFSTKISKCLCDIRINLLNFLSYLMFCVDLTGIAYLEGYAILQVNC